MGGAARVSALAVALAACASFGSAGNETKEPPAGADAAATLDGATPPDAGVAPSGCARFGGAIFCEDFDDAPTGTAPALDRWSGSVDPGNSYSVVAEGLSLPNAVSLEGVGGGYALIYGSLTDPGPPNVTLEYAVFIEDPSAPAVWAQLSWFREQDTKRRAIAVDIAPGASFATQIDGTVTAEESRSTMPLVFAAWTRGWHAVKVEVTSNAKAVTVHVDDLLLGTATYAAEHIPGRLFLEVGAHAFDVAQSQRVLYDDIVIRTP